MLTSRVRPNLLARWRPALRVDVAVPLLLALPWLLLAADPRWVYGSLYRDAWIYFGFFQDLPGHLRAYPDFYGCSRLTVTLPGWLAYRLLPPVAANVALHVAVYYAAVFAGYAVFARVGGRRVGLPVAVLFGGHPFLLKAAGWDYVDGFVIAYFLLAQALLIWAAESDRWRTWSVLAGVAAAAMTVANLAFAPLLLALAAWFVVLNRRGSHLRAAGWFSLGVCGLLIALGLVSAILGGRWFFLTPSLTFVANYTTGIARMYVHPPGDWLGGAVWLVFPAAACVGAVVALVRRAGMRFVQWHLLAASGLLFAAQYQGRFGYLEVWYYASAAVMVPAFTALAGQWSGRLDALSPRQYAGLLAAACGIGLLAAVASRFGVTGPSWLAAVALGCGAVAVLLPALRPEFREGFAAVVLFGLLNVGVQARFRMAEAMPGVAPVLRLEACQDFDPHRKACFLAIHEIARWVRELDEPGRVWFWYHLHESLGPVYDMAAHTHCTYYRVIGWEFPLIREGKMANGRPVGDLTAGGTVVVFCERDEARDEAVRELRAHGVNAEVIGERALGRRSPALIRAFVLRIVP